MRRTSKAPPTGSAHRAESTVAGRKTRGLFGLACLCVLGLAAFLGSSAPAVGAANAFPGQGFLPENRAWEMVSPPDKNGAEVMIDTTRTRAADDGGALGFASLSGFGDAVGAGAMVDYLSVRGAGGWSTHAITPPQLATTTGVGDAEQPFYAAASADLSKGIFRAFSPVTEEPNVANVRNLYLRDDLRTPGAGSYTLLSTSETMQPAPIPATSLAQFAAASSDFSHVTFESRLNLTAEASGELPKLYEWSNGTVRLAGILPDSTCGTPPCPALSSAAGFGMMEPIPSHGDTTLSVDGSKVFFTSPVSSGADPEPDSQLYMRHDHSETVRINASERTSPPPDPVSSGAFFELANPSGTKVFFTSNEQLTDVPVGGGPKLYVYDTTLPDTVPDNLELIAAAGVMGVIGASDDGKVVYFVSEHQLTPDAPPTESPLKKIYRWENGATRYVGSFADIDDAGNSLSRVTYGLARKSSRVSADGRFLTFLSRTGNGLTGFDHSDGCMTLPVGGGRECSEVYVYDAAAAGGDGELFCASCNPDGATATTHATWEGRVGVATTKLASGQTRALLPNGRRVFFTSGEPLVPQDQNGLVRDVYMFDTLTREVHLLSSGESSQPSFFLNASASGNDVFFATREPLSGWDVDSGFDVYDARVNGGVPEPSAPPPSCQGDACQPLPASLQDSTPASSTFAGAGSQSTRAEVRKRCGKAKRRVTRNGKARCVKRKSAAKRRNRANADRKASR